MKTSEIRSRGMVIARHGHLGGEGVAEGESTYVRSHFASSRFGLPAQIYLRFQDGRKFQCFVRCWGWQPSWLRGWGWQPAWLRCCPAEVYGRLSRARHLEPWAPPLPTIERAGACRSLMLTSPCRSGCGCGEVEGRTIESGPKGERGEAAEDRQKLCCTHRRHSKGSQIAERWPAAKAGSRFHNKIGGIPQLSRRARTPYRPATK